MAIVPGSTELTAHYWKAAAAGQLTAQQCRNCGRLRHPPLPRCPGCHSSEFDWRPLCGNGSVYTYTVVHHATHVVLRDFVPYVVALIELEEGLRVIANIHECSAGDIFVAMPVRLVFQQVDETVTLPQFVPLKNADQSPLN